MIRLSPVVMVVAVALTACMAPESVNPALRCTSDVSCSAREHCYRSFCVLDDTSARASDAAETVPPKIPDAGPVCQDGAVLCSDGCVDLWSDDHHCGMCEIKCGHHTHCITGRCAEDS